MRCKSKKKEDCYFVVRNTLPYRRKSWGPKKQSRSVWRRRGRKLRRRAPSTTSPTLTSMSPRSVSGGTARSTAAFYVDVRFLTLCVWHVFEIFLYFSIWLDIYVVCLKMFSISRRRIVVRSGCLVSGWCDRRRRRCRRARRCLASTRSVRRKQNAYDLFLPHYYGTKVSRFFKLRGRTQLKI